MNSVLIALLLLGDEPMPAHKMPDLERAQRRMHAGDAELRRLRGEAEGLIGLNGSGEVVIGEHNPELFFRWELINRVVGFLRDETLFAKFVPKWEARGAKRYLGDDYLPRLQKIVEKAVVAENERQRLQVLLDSGKAADVERTREEQTRLDRSLCALRAEALAAARAEFGYDVFDRFLYEVVAPDGVSYGRIGSTPENTVDTSMWIEQGCP